MTVLAPARQRSLDRLLGLWDDLVDPCVGVIQKVSELPLDDDEPAFFHYISRACDTSRLGALKNFGNNGGVSTDRYTAIAKAIGEGIERYCSAIFAYRELVFAAFEELDERAAHPGEFALYEPEQHAVEGFPWQPFTEAAPVAWKRGRSLADGEPTLVPAAMVHVPYHYLRSRPDTPIVQPISTGLACGCSFAEAAISGLCEAIERDAFTLAWQARIARPRIDADTVPPRVADLLDRYAAAGLRVELVDITTDVAVPTVMTVALSDAPTSPAVAVAAAADPSPEMALVKSLEELAHTRKFARQVMNCTPPLPVDVERGHPAVREQQHHLRYYCPQEARAFIAFAFESDELRPFSALADRSCGDPARELAALVDAVAARGLDPVACDLTTGDMAPLGLAVVRVVVPGLHPLFMGHANRALGGRRLAELSRGPDNPHPHPFP